MNYQLLPLAFYQTNWAGFIDLYNKIFDESPTRTLDSCNIALDKPVALQRSLKEHFGPESDRLIDLAFIGTANASMLIEISQYLNPISRESTEERGLYIYIINASLKDWKDAITLFDKSKSKNIRNLSDQLITVIKMAGYSV